MREKKEEVSKKSEKRAGRKEKGSVVVCNERVLIQSVDILSSRHCDEPRPVRTPKLPFLLSSFQLSG